MAWSGGGTSSARLDDIVQGEEAHGEHAAFTGSMGGVTLRGMTSALERRTLSALADQWMLAWESHLREGMEEWAACRRRTYGVHSAVQGARGRRAA